MAAHVRFDDEGDAQALKVCHGKGCVECRHTGLKERIGVYEMLQISDRIQRLVMEGAPATEIMKVARGDGMAVLRESAIRKLVTGETSFEEVLRVTSD